MNTKAPDHHDAELVFRAYDLRRESVMRESRNAINQKFWPKSYDEIAAILKADHPLNAPFRQVSGYWEMVYGVVKHGIVNADYYMESNGEGLFFFARVAPHLDALRRDTAPTTLQNAEWVSKETAVGRRLFAMFSERVRKALETR